MEAIGLHSWQVSVRQALEIQRQLAAQVSRSGTPSPPRLIAGVDIAVSRTGGAAIGAVVVIEYPELRLVEVATARDKINFPYIPGLLSFRELPLILAAGEKLNVAPGLVLVDGQGIAHPRRLGLASHLGLLWDIPTIGCAKSRLCGGHEAPGETVGSYSELVDRGETIGAILRTRTGIRPVYVSTGHKIDLQAAINWVLMSCRGYRLPEPTRLAHLAAGGNLGSMTAHRAVAVGKSG